MILLENTDPTLSNNSLSCLEKYWGFKLPKEYRDFLLKVNGGFPKERSEFCFKDSNEGSVLAAFLGITPQPHNDLLDYLRVYTTRIPNNMFPIGYDTFGNLILLSVKGQDRGKIYFWDHEQEAQDGATPDYSNLSLIADNFDEFLNGLKSEEEIEINDLEPKL